MRRRGVDRWPQSQEEQLAARLQRRARAVRTLILDQLRAVRRGARADSVFGSSALGPRIRLAVGSAGPVRPSSLVDAGRAVSAAVTHGVVADLGTDETPTDSIADLVHDWAQTTADRASEGEGALIDRALAAADEAADAGRDPIAAAREALDSAERLAELLARDAVGNLTAEVSRTRAQELGSERFVWRTRRDERVRERHVELEGTEWRWDAPPADEGLPGEPRNCRCWAQAIPAPVAEAAPTPAPKRTRKPRPRKPKAPAVAPPPAPAERAAPAPAPPPPTPTPTPAAPPPPSPTAPAPVARVPLDLAKVRRLDLFGGKTEAKATELVTRTLGRPATPSDVLRWAGVREEDLEGVRVEMRADSPTRIGLTISGPGWTMERSYSSRPSGLYAYHEFFKVGQGGEGVGRDIFARQVEELRAGGFRAIETKAAGGPGQELVGYYVWPRLGFDGELPAKVRDLLPPELAGAVRVSDLVSTPAGRDWWKANGSSIEVAFDLAPASKGSQVLDAYLAEKRAARGDAAALEEADMITLGPADEAILDRVWARVTGGRAA